MISIRNILLFHSPGVDKGAKTLFIWDKDRIYLGNDFFYHFASIYLFVLLNI